MAAALARRVSGVYPQFDIHSNFHSPHSVNVLRFNALNQCWSNCAAGGSLATERQRSPGLRVHCVSSHVSPCRPCVPAGLLRPLSVSLCARTPQLCQLSSLIRPQPLCGPAAAAVRAPLRAAVCPAPRCSILQR